LCLSRETIIVSLPGEVFSLTEDLLMGDPFSYDPFSLWDNLHALFTWCESTRFHDFG
jgi:hypothetical protein